MERGHLRAGWVAGDDAFGMSPSFREGLAALGCATCWTFPAAPRSGRWSQPGPVRSIRGSGVPASPGWWAGSGAPWRSAVLNCRREPDVRLRWPREARVPQLPVQRPAGASNPQAEARRNPLGRLPPEPGRQRAPILPVQRSSGHSPGDPGLRGRVPVAHRNGV